MTERRKVIVVGAGLAGLAAALRAAENGLKVILVSLSPARRSHSVCAQGGINAASVAQGDSPLYHAYDTIKGGDFLADQPPIVEMCLAAPKIIEMLDRFGCPFNRIQSGHLDRRRFGGTLYSRTVFCGSTTGQQLLYTLDEQVRKQESLGHVVRFEHHEFLRLILDENGVSRGIVMMDHQTLELRVLSADAIVIATGGAGFIFRKSTNSTCCTAAANGRLYLQGMHYANGEFIQIHPTAIPGHDKLRLISESSRGEGGRIWVKGDASKTITASDGRILPCGVTGEPWYFLEELYPGYGNLVGRDVAAREILRVVEMGLGVDGGSSVYLDVCHLPASTLKKLDSVLEIYEKYTGENPRKVPMKIFPAVHYSMGGAWVDWPAADDSDRIKRFRQMTNLAGLFNCGESDFLYHGANRLGANSLLSCIYSGLVTGDELTRYLEGVVQNSSEGPFKAALAIEEANQKSLLNASGSENPLLLHEKLASLMVHEVTVKREKEGLLRAIENIEEIKERAHRISLSDNSRKGNQVFRFANQLLPMIELAHVMAKGALFREESRGSHYRLDFPNRDDAKWLKTTLAVYDPINEEPLLSTLPVDIRHFEPERRDYTHASKEVPQAKNLPQNISLPLP